MLEPELGLRRLMMQIVDVPMGFASFAPSGGELAPRPKAKITSYVEERLKGEASLCSLWASLGQDGLTLASFYEDNAQATFSVVQRACIRDLGYVRSKNFGQGYLEVYRRALQFLLRAGLKPGSDAHQILRRTLRQFEVLEDGNEYLPELDVA